MQKVRCNLCNKDNIEPYAKIGKWNIVKCKNCGLVYLNPRPSEKMLDKLYSESYFKNHSIEYTKTKEQVRKGIENQYPRLKRIMKLYPKPGKILDIGCASGFFLACAQEHGWKARGVDISEWSTNFAREKLKLDVKTGKLEELELEDDFDVITMFHNLEHQPNPLKILSIVKRLLKDDGLLVVELPNINSFDARFHKKKWTGWSLPFHFYFFSPKTLTKMLNEAGFKVIKVYYKISVVAYDRIKKVFKIKKVPKVLTFLLKPFFRGRDVTVYARKI